MPTPPPSAPFNPAPLVTPARRIYLVPEDLESVIVLTQMRAGTWNYTAESRLSGTWHRTANGPIYADSIAQILDYYGGYAEWSRWESNGA